MITNIDIQNFKSHAETKLNLSNLNIFTGMNGMGKSSVIQALLLLRQTHQKNMLEQGLELKGNLCSMGTTKDALYQSAENDEFSILVKTDNQNKGFFGTYLVDRNNFEKTYAKKELSVSNNFNIDFSLFNNHFQYISAFRNGPLQSYEKDTSTVELFNQMSLIEGRSELVAHYLDYFGEESIVDDSLKKNPEDEFIDLKFQTSQWLKEISPEIDIHISSGQTSYKIDYSFNRGSGKTPTEKFKAYNVGFGVSYVLPIVVAALHSAKDSLVIVENPEAHLHPEGIANLMKLISKAANTGVQFIIETHSDHVINGMLVAVKKGLIPHSNVKVYHFARNKEMHQTTTTQLEVLKGGKIRKPPKGFFDRMDKDLDILTDMVDDDE
ncbi:MAG: DUF3696 domain-containing protein [Bacteroidales bacterium]|nr:DUF3696 domain-containing protein [Bacteroidales bacterium]